MDVTPIRCLVFDFDGVLVDSNSFKRAAYFDVFAGLPAEDALRDALQENPEGTRYDVIAAALEKLTVAGLLEEKVPPGLLVERYAERYNALCEGFAGTCREIPGVSAVLPRLAAVYPLYINSATPVDPLRRIVRRREWGGHFRGVLGAPSSKLDNLREVQRLEALEPSEIVFVGDSQRDLNAARHCGCSFVGVRNADNDFVRDVPLMVDDLYRLEAALQPAGNLQKAK